MLRLFGAPSRARLRRLPGGRTVGRRPRGPRGALAAVSAARPRRALRRRITARRSNAPPRYVTCGVAGTMPAMDLGLAGKVLRGDAARAAASASRSAAALRRGRAGRCSSGATPSALRRGRRGCGARLPGRRRHRSRHRRAHRRDLRRADGRHRRARQQRGHELRPRRSTTSPTRTGAGSGTARHGAHAADAGGRAAHGASAAAGGSSTSARARASALADQRRLLW